MKKQKLSILITTALSTLLFLGNITSYAAPQATSNKQTEEFNTIEELKDVNDGQVPEYFSDDKEDFKFIDGSYTNIKVDTKDDAVNSINSIKNLMNIDYPADELEVVKVNQSKYVNSYKLQQVYNRVPVYGREVVVITDKEGNTTSVGGNYLKDLNVNTRPALGQVEAGSHALKNFEKDAKVSANELAIYTLDDTTPTLCWKVTIDGVKNGETAYEDVFVNANTGDIVTEVSLLHEAATTASGKDLKGVTQQFNANTARVRTGSWWSYSYKNVFELYDTVRNIVINDYSTGSTVYSTTSTFNDPAAVSALVNIAKTYDYYKNALGRNSYDDNGAVIPATVHYTENGRGYDNAYWSPQENKFVFGDGETYFTPLSGALDVIGHEFTHAVVSNTCDLRYQGESGALNEAYADIMGNFIEGKNESRWLIGEDIMKNGDAGLRCMSNPEQFSQPSKVGGRYYVNPNSSRDNGGVHTNSGILNHAAYLMWKNGISNKSKLADLFYNSLFLMNSSSNFKQCRIAVLKAAKNMSMTSSEIQIIKDAFDTVGITA